MAPGNLTSLRGPLVLVALCALARELAARGATVLLHGRDSAKGEATLRELRKATGNFRFRLTSPT
jgi:hypothetical protein